jgi:hypothetical protein
MIPEIPSFISIVDVATTLVKFRRNSVSFLLFRTKRFLDFSLPSVVLFSQARTSGLSTDNNKVRRSILHGCIFHEEHLGCRHGREVNLLHRNSQKCQRKSRRERNKILHRGWKCSLIKGGTKKLQNSSVSLSFPRLNKFYKFLYVCLFRVNSKTSGSICFKQNLLQRQHFQLYFALYFTTI